MDTILSDDLTILVDTSCINLFIDFQNISYELCWVKQIFFSFLVNWYCTYLEKILPLQLSEPIAHLWVDSLLRMHKKLWPHVVRTWHQVNLTRAFLHLSVKCACIVTCLTEHKLTSLSTYMRILCLLLCDLVYKLKCWSLSSSSQWDGLGKFLIFPFVLCNLLSHNIHTLSKFASIYLWLGYLYVSVLFF